MNSRYGEKSFASVTPILQKLYKHEKVRYCQVCEEEELKSPALKIQRTKLLEKVILPLNECWICDFKINDTDLQVEHFSEYHECDESDNNSGGLETPSLAGSESDESAIYFGDRLIRTYSENGPKWRACCVII